MKSAVVYYSYNGNTKKVAGVLSEILSAKGSVEVFALRAQDESNNFLRQCKRAFSNTRATLEEVNFELGPYDVICFGTPVWAFAPAPAMNTYLDKCAGVAGKDVVLFSTYGSGTGKNRCLKLMQNILSRKGAKSFKAFGVQQGKVQDKEFVLSQIKAVMPLSPNG